jgi:hypothetical protein
MDSSTPLSIVVGNAAFLLSDWEKFSLSERTLYHFDLIAALDCTIEPPEDFPEEELSNICGVKALLECIPKDTRLSSDQKRKLKSEIRQLNAQSRKSKCYQPTRLPLKLTTASSVFFTYDLTRIAFCLDASPTLTSTFGFGGSSEDSASCPIDRLGEMTRTFLNALVKPIVYPTAENKGLRRPELSITVLAVFPRGKSEPLTTLLARDFRVNGETSADLLADKIEQWALGPVETEIAQRLAHPTGEFSLLASYDAGVMPMFSSKLSDIVEAGDVALSTLSSAARPVIVIATDGRSVACDPLIGFISDADRVDVPIVVLDLSSSESHSPLGHSMCSSTVNEGTIKDRAHLLRDDPGGALFPLHLSDDTEALYSVCRATGGCFLDSKLLNEAARTSAGNVHTHSSLFADHFFSYKRHTLRPNGVQWYTLFSLSPLSPTINNNFGRLAPPEYIKKRNDAPVEIGGPQQSTIFPRPLSTKNDRMVSTSTIDSTRRSVEYQRKQHVRTIFSTYFVNPIRIKAPLLTRIREGYRAKQYGSSTNEPDKVSIQFTLPLDLGTCLHYELSYRSLPGHNHMTGFAHIKIELSGETNFVQIVKSDFLHQGDRALPTTMAQQVSLRLCNLLRWIRQEDMLQSYLSPIKWSDQLASSSTPFVKRLGSLTPLQRKRHFRVDEFDCVFTGRMPYEEEDASSSIFGDFDYGEQELSEALNDYATQIIVERKSFVKHIRSSVCGLPRYCVIELTRSVVATRVFTISVSTFASMEPGERVKLIDSIKCMLNDLKDISVLDKQMAKYLVGVRLHDTLALTSEQTLLGSQHNHASWDLVKDPELLPLLIKRRIEIGGFTLLESNKDHALLAKLVPSKISGHGDDLLQYQLSVLRDFVVVDLHMESESGQFTSSQSSADANFKFSSIVRDLKTRDQECGRALQCRTNLLRVFDIENVEKMEDHLSCVRRLVAYASNKSIKLRFFHRGSGEANQILRSMTEDMLLATKFSAQVAKLNISFDDAVSTDVESGDWFLCVHDKHVMSMIHVASSETSEQHQDGSLIACRELTYWTFEVTDVRFCDNLCITAF